MINPCYFCGKDRHQHSFPNGYCNIEKQEQYITSAQGKFVEKKVLSEIEKIIKERITEIEKDIENPIYCIDYLIVARDESKSILSAIRKLKGE